MTPSHNARHSVAFKLSLTALLSLLLVLLATMGVVSLLLWKDFGRMSRDDASQYAAQVRTLVQTFDETAQQQAQRDYALFKSRFTGQFTVNEAPGPDGKPEAVLTFQDVLLNGNFEAMDRYTQESQGAVATIFARTGDDFIRVTTSVKKQDGERAYKTLLDRKSPAYALMNEGKTYIGRANLFGREYMTVYEPIRENGRTIGILFIGSEIGAILGKLDTVMAGQKLFQSGAAKNQEFTLVSLHALPTKHQPETEIKYLKTFKDTYPNSNLIFLGDFNLPQKHSVFEPIKKQGYQPAFVNQKTSLKQKCINGDCLASEYDNFFLDQIKNVLCNLQAIHFYKDFTDIKLAREISDHIPLLIEIE